MGLYISDNPITDVKPLLELKKLKGVTLNKTLVHDIMPLTKHPTLKQINLRGARVSDEQIEQFHVIRPDIYIEY